MLIAKKYMGNPVEDQRDAEKVRNTLNKLAKEYGSVSVADYTIHCISRGYTIDLPKPSKRR